MRRGAAPPTRLQSARQISGIYLENFLPGLCWCCRREGMRSSTMADKGLSITPCNNAAIRQAARMLGQLYDDALAPSGLRATQHNLLNTIHRMDGPDAARDGNRAGHGSFGAGTFLEAAGPRRSGCHCARCARPPRQTSDADQGGIEEASGDDAAMARRAEPVRGRFRVAAGGRAARESRQSIDRASFAKPFGMVARLPRDDSGIESFDRSRSDPGASPPRHNFARDQGTDGGLARSGV